MTTHNLKAKGAAFNPETGSLVHSRTTSGTGVAKCSCGWMSENLESGRARVAAHKQHKADVLEQPEKPVEEPTPAEGTDQTVQEPLEEPEPVSQAEEEKPDHKFDVEVMKAKISKLLAKAERTQNEEERHAYSAKAEKLMIRLGVGVAELEAAGAVDPSKIVQVERVYPGNYSIVMIPFVSSVARGFGNITILQTTYQHKLERVAHIIGLEDDVERFTQLLDSLTVQVMAALRVWQKENIEWRRHQTDMEKYLGHRSFISGFGMRVGERLEETRQQEESQASTGAALVLAGKQEKIDTWVAESYGELAPSRGGARRYSSAGLRAGYQAGEKADLGSKRIDKQQEVTS